MQIFVFLQTLYLALNEVTQIEEDGLEHFVQQHALSVILIKEKASPTYENLIEDMSEVFDGFVLFGVVDYHQKIPADFKAQTYPAIKIVTERSVFTDYKKGAEPQELFSEILKHLESVLKKRFSSKVFVIPETFVVTLDQSNFTRTIENSDSSYLVEFFAPWCGYCKALAPHWKAAAEKLDGKMKLAAVDATVNQKLAYEFKIKGYPTIKFIPAKSKAPFVGEAYSGGRTTEDIVSWAEDKLSQLVAPSGLVHVISQADLTEKCLSGGICVMAFFPKRLDTDAKTWRSYIDTLSQVIDVFKPASYRWVWLEGGIDVKFEESLGVGGSGYPVLLVLDYKKKTFSVMKGSFAVSSIKSFLSNFASGATPTKVISGQLPELKDLKEWDGLEFKKSDL